MVMVEVGVRRLNPNAPMFIPAAYREVEDFSPQWWDLVKTCRWFQDYWLSQYQDDWFEGEEDDVETQFEELVMWFEEAKDEIGSVNVDANKQARLLNGLKIDAKALLNLETSKFAKGRNLDWSANKTAKVTSPKCIPRRTHQIHQPR